MSLPARALVPTIAALALIGFLPPQVARAAEGLEVVAATTYQLLPSEGRVHVTVNANVTSRTPDTPDGRVITGLSFSAQPGIRNVAARSGTAALTVKIEKRTDEFTGLAVTFGRPLAFEDSYRYAVSFDLVDPGGAAGRDIRIGRSVVALPVWAFGSDGVPGSSVRVEVPAGYSTSVEGSHMASVGDPDGPTTLSASNLADPFAFFAYVSADRPGAFSETPVSITLDGRKTTINVRAWQDDPEWGSRMKNLLRGGLPALHELIGLEYTVGGALNVEEAATSRLGEYAGIFNDVDDTITVRYDANAFVGLHEAAHIWFNERLFPERWIGEAFAEFYAVQAGTQIGASGDTFELNDGLLEHRVALNSWGKVGVEDLAVEDYAYAATYHLATLIFARTDLEGLRNIWKAAANDELAYRPMHPGISPGISIAVTQQGWQRLLDLLEERTGDNYSDLWDEWVVSDADRPLLAERTDARDTYRSVAARAGTWELPQRIRYDLGSWKFDDAQAEMNSAAAVMVQRDLIATKATALTLEPPPMLRSTFEGGRGLDAAADEATAELASLAAIGRATDLLAPAPSTLETIGLIGLEPPRELSAARTGFESGDLGEADAGAAIAAAARIGAQDAGRQRVAITGGGLLGLDLLAMTALALRRRSRRRRLERLRARVNPPTFSPPIGPAS